MTHKDMAATYIGFTSPDCATPSNFLRSLTSYSTIVRLNLISC